MTNGDYFNASNSPFRFCFIVSSKIYTKASVSLKINKYLFSSKVAKLSSFNFFACGTCSFYLSYLYIRMISNEKQSPSQSTSCGVMSFKHKSVHLLSYIEIGQLGSVNESDRHQLKIKDFVLMRGHS